MKITKKQLRRIIKEEKAKLIREANVDGTISPDEDERRADLLTHVEIAIDELIQYCVNEANDVGGSFRAPGIKAECKDLMLEKISRATWR